ncbi:SusC/RagA family TonB-linked outer membrane protein [Flavivirga spongiicola]|uniref:SusC/RagA family TonB-linked outer membrane protein n=1 Tax=Flavivirga spongiicola TaxID=421621 RepID=A0ABU7XQK1_9FLAO|nr:SusC/RagA family TonB-linked outer membrane protein [Flavivirga sp. MEBiC05379]MDO5977831.1 SusC/RagA family TonB-linked outer membrane protein [Flavivirga sp. MEBiC05379]
MRTFIFLFCSTVFSFSSTGVFSQNTKIEIDTDKTITIDEVFSIIKQQTDFNFIYKSDIFKDYPKIDVKKGIIKANRLLEKSLSKGDFKFNISSKNTIIIRQASDLQSINVSGQITDANKLPLAGITVYVSNRQPATGKISSDFIIRGTTTDFDGKFSIKADIGSYLVASGLGYEMSSLEIVASQTVYNFVLNEKTDVLDEVIIVSTGYQEISRERSTGAFVGVTKKQLEKPASSISERLVGQVAGLQSTINADGSIDFEIRGQSSLFVGGQPLIVYDGFPIEGGFETINPNDVESITVLKDAAAASIWGARSAGGVIVVTSKKAKQGKTSVSVSSFIKASPKLDIDYTTGWASSREVLDYEQRGFDTNFFGSVFGGPPSASVFAVSRPYSLGITAMNEARLGRITDAERDATLTRLADSNNRGQIEDFLLDVPMTKQYNVSVSGGTETMKNRLTLLFEDNNTFFKGTESKKYQIDFASNVKLNKRLRFDFAGMLQGTDGDNNGTNLNFIRSLAPYDMLVNPDGSLVDMSYLTYYKPNLDAFVPTELFPDSDWSFNPIRDINEKDLNTKQLNYRIQAGLTLEILEGLNLSSKIQYETFKVETENYFKEGSFDVRRFVNETSSWNFSPSAPTQNVPSGGVLQQNESTTNAYNFRNQLSFNRTFLDKHTVSLVAGSEITERVTKFTRNPDAFGYNGDKLTTAEIDAPDGATLWNGFPFRFAGFFYPFRATNNVHSFSENTRRFFSLYGNAAYTFDNKYTVSGSYRTDASNIIADDPSLRYNPFWSVGTSWNAHNESFLQGTSWLDRLKVRATLGYNGNLAGSDSFEPLISLSQTPDISSGEIEASISSFGNPNLRWERTRTLNLGLDFSILNRKLYGSLELYNRKSSSLIVTQSISAVNGTTNQRFNNGEMVNKGFEITLGTTIPIKGNDIVWSGSVNFAHNDNEITKFFKSDYQSFDLAWEVFFNDNTTAFVEGYDANTMWSYQYAGLTNVGTDANPILKPSIFIEDGEQATLLGFPPGEATNYFKPQGTTKAPTIVGMRNSFKIYDFDFSFIVTGKFGHVFRRQGFNYSGITGGNTFVNTKYNEVANGDPNQIIPIPDSEGRYFFYDRFYNNMDYLTADASHIRFQEISLSYALPKKITDKLGINSLNIYAQANNIGTILFNDFGEDPEYPIGNLKLQKSFTFGMNFNF